MSSDFSRRLSESPKVTAIANHPVFEYASNTAIEMQAGQHCVEQFWQSTSYFPQFLAGLIHVAPVMTVQTPLSKILYQEFGEGKPADAHPTLYLGMLERLGFDVPAIRRSKPTATTQHVLDAYYRGSGDFFFGLGCIYGIESVDMAIVEGIGSIITAATGETKLEWVMIHTDLEEEHVESASQAIEYPLTAEDEKIVLEGADAIWDAQYNFYSGLLNDITKGAPR